MEASKNMHRIELEQANADEALVRLDSEARRRLASVLADWLSLYAGVQPKDLDEESFNLAVEVRRILLIPDERAAVAENHTVT